MIGLLDVGKGNSGLHRLQNLLWKRLWTCPKTDDMIMMSIRRKVLGTILPKRIWLVTASLLEGYRSLCLLSPYRAQRFDFYLFFTDWIAPGWQAISSRCRREASCPFMATDTWYRFFSTPEYKLWCHDGTNSEMSVTTSWKSVVYHLRPMCHIDIEVRVMFSASEGLFWYFLNCFWFSLSLHRAFCSLFKYHTNK
jgi:hypothetical protein